MADDDMRLVRDFVEHGSEQAFAGIVARHINLVYSVAYRQAGDPHAAEEITQAVFIVLARKAGSLGPKTVLSGWLCRTARFVASNQRTVERRRQAREQEAFMQSQGAHSDHETWSRVAPLLDSALARLPDSDQDAIALRYFQGRSFHEVGEALGASEETAKKRVQRALEKLHRIFQRHGITLSAVTIAVALSEHAVQAAPAGLSTTIALSPATMAAGSAASPILVEITLKLMAWSKIKTASVVGVLAILVAGTATMVVHQLHAPHRSPPLVFAGYATPEDTVRSSVWAGSIGDFNRFLEGCTPEQVERFKRKMAGLSEEQIRNHAIDWAGAMKDYRITGKDVISDHEVRLHLTAPPSPHGLRNGNVVVVLQRVGEEWKQAGDL